MGGGGLNEARKRPGDLPGLGCGESYLGSGDLTVDSLPDTIPPICIYAG